MPKELCNTTERRGYLRLYGTESLNSRYTQSLVARRQEELKYIAETCVEFEPDTHLQAAGLVVYYDTSAYCYLKVTYNEKLGKCVGITANDCGEFYQPLELNVSVDGAERVYLRAEGDGAKLKFSYSTDGKDWKYIGGTLDTSSLSDELSGSGGFTGTFVGLCVQDLSGRRKYADFDYLMYKDFEN